MEKQNKTQEEQQLQKRIQENESLAWFLKELEEILAFRDTVIDRVILILQECQIPEKTISEMLQKYFLLDKEQAEEKMKSE